MFSLITIIIFNNSSSNINPTFKTTYTEFRDITKLIKFVCLYLQFLVVNNSAEYQKQRPINFTIVTNSSLYPTTSKLNNKLRNRKPRHLL